MIGLERGKVTLYIHNPVWNTEAARTIKVLKEILGDIATETEHVGSTAVNTIMAKPIIDIMPVVFELEAVDAAAGEFEKAGYEYMGEFGIAGRRYLRKGGCERTHQVHIFRQEDRYNIGRHLAFRDYLRCHCEEAERYAREVITSGYHSLNPSYSQIFINYSQNLYDLKESIWEIEYYGDNTQYYTAGHVGRNTGIPSASDSPIGHCLGMIRSTANHYDMYDATDVRRDWNIGPYSYNEDGSHKMLSESDDKNIRYCAKFRREYEDVVSDSKMPTATAINFPVLRYADVLLMYAEAHFCNPDADAARDAEALECFNMVRRYTQQMSFVWGTIPDSSPWKKYADIYFGSISSRDRLWPIPSDEMSVDGNLVQNPGW